MIAVNQPADTPENDDNSADKAPSPSQPTPSKRKTRFKVLSDKDLETLEDPTWRVEKVLPSDSLSMLFGEPGAGKTFLALDFAYSLASGHAWFGHQTTPGAIVYVIAEGVKGLKQRAAAWKYANDRSEVERVHFVKESVQLCDPREVKQFVADLKAQIEEPIVLIVFDTLARCFVGRDENSAKDTGLLVDGAEIIRKETGAAIVLVHHTTKKGKEERGSSALRGATDTMISVSKFARTITVACEKQKDSEQFGPKDLRLVPTLDSCVLMEEMADSASPKEVDCLKVLDALGQQGSVTCGDWLAASGLKQSTFYCFRAGLDSSGLIRQDEDGYVLTDKGKEAITVTPNLTLTS
jgi:hypothetical protein